MKDLAEKKEFLLDILDKLEAQQKTIIKEILEIKKQIAQIDAILGK